MTAAGAAEQQEKIEQGTYPIGEAALLSLGFSINHMESLHKRSVESGTRMTLSLVSTESSEILWKDTIDITDKAEGTVPGISLRGNKDNKLAVSSLKLAVNELVAQLEDAPFGKPEPDETDEEVQPIVQNGESVPAE